MMKKRLLQEGKMTDKQIIINDYFNIMRDENGRLFGIQEIGDIRQLIKDIREQNEYIQTKEQECEELKAKIKYMEEYIKTVENARNEFEKESNFLKEENKRLKQTLAEIKEIAKKTLNMVDYKTYFKRDNKSLKQEGFKALNEILQKISEVEK